jgi:hypothetical protein
VTFLPIGIHLEYRYTLEEKQGYHAHYPAHRGDDPRIWTGPGAVEPRATRARLDRRVTVSFTLPWIPGRWRTGTAPMSDEPWEA